MKHLSIGCLVLASGQSKRFGSNKLLAPFCGMPLLEFTLNQIPKQLFSRCVVVTRTPACCDIAERCGFEAVLHDEPLRRDSIRLGISQLLDMDGCLVVQADQPLCRPESYAALVGAFCAQPSRFYRLCWQNTASSPVLFPQSSFAALCSLPEKAGGAFVIPKDPQMVQLIPARFGWELEDTDTPQALAALEKIAYSL